LANLVTQRLQQFDRALQIGLGDLGGLHDRDTPESSGQSAKERCGAIDESCEYRHRNTARLAGAGTGGWSELQV
jgi:hypothetical protein